MCTNTCVRVCEHVFTSVCVCVRERDRDRERERRKERCLCIASDNNELIGDPKHTPNKHNETKNENNQSYNLFLDYNASTLCHTLHLSSARVHTLSKIIHWWLSKVSEWASGRPTKRTRVWSTNGLCALQQNNIKSLMPAGVLKMKQSEHDFTAWNGSWSLDFFFF